MAEFGYNNVKNPNTSYMLFELNYEQHFWMLNKKNVNRRSKSKSTNKLLVKLRKLMIIYSENLYYFQEFQK